jgi:TM2 domain-containing membrane protein YozV
MPGPNQLDIPAQPGAGQYRGPEYGQPQYGGQPYGPQYGQPNGAPPNGPAAPPGGAPNMAAGGERSRAQPWPDAPGQGTGMPPGAGYGPGAAGWGAWQGRPAPIVMPKNGGLGVLVSFFLPGVGSMINGSVGLGVAILISYAVSWLLTLVLIGIPLVFGVWIWGMVDGYQSAQRWNKAHGIIS